MKEDDSDVPIRDQDVWADMIQSNLEHKWNDQDEEANNRLLRFMAAHNGLGIDIIRHSLVKAVKRLKRRHVRDASRMAASFILLTFTTLAASSVDILDHIAYIVTQELSWDRGHATRS